MSLHWPQRIRNRARVLNPEKGCNFELLNHMVIDIDIDCLSMIIDKQTK